jgi:hypothetical protein
MIPPPRIATEFDALHQKGTVGTEIATSTFGGSIPFRPSADGTLCTNPGTDANGGNDEGKFYDAAANLCLNALP